MKKKNWVWLFILAPLVIAVAVAWAADTKITGLTADTSPTSDDLVVTVNAPGSSPANRKVTADALVKAILVNPGSIGATATRSTKGWFIDLETTNYPTVNGAAVFDQDVSADGNPSFSTINVVGTNSLNLGTAGSLVGQVTFKNATSGGITVQPITGALGTTSLILGTTFTDATWCSYATASGFTCNQTAPQSASATLTSLAGLTETAGGIPYGTADNAYAWLAAGATTTVLVGGGAAAPVWTTATGSGAPVRATSPVLVTPTLGAATATSLAVTAAAATGGILDLLEGSDNGTSYLRVQANASMATTSGFTISSDVTTESFSVTLGATGSDTVTFASASGAGFTFTPNTTFSGTLGAGATTVTTLNGHTFTTGSSTFTGTAGQVYTFPTTTATLARTDAGQTFTGVQAFTAPTVATSIAPASADGATLGTAAAEFSDLYLADGGVIYFQNDQSVYLTPSAATLTLTGNLVTTGTISGGLPRLGTWASPITSVGAYALAAANAYGTWIYYNDTDEITLPAGVAGMSVCVQVPAATLVPVGPNGTDVIVLEGTALSAGQAFSIAAVAGNFACLIADAVNHWVTAGTKGTLTAIP